MLKWYYVSQSFYNRNKTLYCVFQYHANSEVQNPTNDWQRFTSLRRRRTLPAVKSNHNHYYDKQRTLKIETKWIEMHQSQSMDVTFEPVEVFKTMDDILKCNCWLSYELQNSHVITWQLFPLTILFLCWFKVKTDQHQTKEHLLNETTVTIRFTQWNFKS